MNYYHIFATSKCPFCVEAQQELLRRKKTHTVVVMDEKPEELNEDKKLSQNHYLLTGKIYCL